MEGASQLVSKLESYFLGEHFCHFACVQQSMMAFHKSRSKASLVNPVKSSEKSPLDELQGQVCYRLLKQIMISVHLDVTKAQGPCRSGWLNPLRVREWSMIVANRGQGRRSDQVLKVVPWFQVEQCTTLWRYRYEKCLICWMIGLQISPRGRQLTLSSRAMLATKKYLSKVHVVVPSIVSCYGSLKTSLGSECCYKLQSYRPP